MNYSPSQIRQIVGIPQETLRHWRKVFPPISKRNGWHSFSTGDALALLIIKELSLSIGIQVNSIAQHASTLFDLCHVLRWNGYKNKILIYSPTHYGFEIADNSSVFTDFQSPCMAIDICKHIEILNDKIIGGDTSEQLEMLFPPRAVHRL